MDFRRLARENFVRILALVCLVIGLSDAARLLGVSGGGAGPLQAMGTTGFVLLAIFAVSRLFAGVGLWINSSWGGVLLVGATLAELGLYFSGSPYVDIGMPGLSVRIALLLGILGFLGVRTLRARRHVHD